MDDEAAVQIALNYHLLKDSLRELQEAKKDKQGVVLHYATHYYNEAQRAIESLISNITPELRTRLNLQELEEQLIGFGNTHIPL